MNKLLQRALLLWILFIPVAILNGAIRNFVYKPFVGDLIAHQISTIIAITLFIFLGYLIFKNVAHLHEDRELILTGVFLVILTIFFEFGFGHFVMGNPWDKLLFDYNIFMGRTWALLLFAILVTPLLAKKLAQRGIIGKRGDIYASQENKKGRI